MASKKTLYRCWSCGCYVGTKYLKNPKNAGECPVCYKVVDTEFEPTATDLRNLNKKIQEERKNARGR